MQFGIADETWAGIFRLRLPDHPTPAPAKRAFGLVPMKVQPERGSLPRLAPADCETQRSRRPGLRASGGWSNSVSKATSRSLVEEASILRSDSLVNAGAESGDPGCSIWAPAET